MKKLEELTNYGKVLSKKKKELENHIIELENEIEFLKSYNKDTTLLENILKLNKKYYSIFSELYDFTSEKESQ